MEPITREEILLNAVATGDAPELKPITREEMFLAKAAGMDVSTPEPITRREIFLSQISGGSGGDYEAMLASMIDGTATHVTIPNVCEAIRASCFSGCKSLVSVSIPDSVESIAGSAFNKLPLLKSIVIPDSVTSVASSSIGSGVFAACTSMESAVIGKNVPALTGGSFMGNTSLKTVTFRGKTTLSSLMGVYPFNSCPGLTDIYVPWAEGEVAGAPWDATNATIHYNHTEG